MCGIVAIISPSIPIRDDLLTAMRDRLVHRGPDAGINWCEPNKRIGLAHRRLSIIDISHAADQPMISSDGTMWIVFNGEIYNYIELRNELESYGIQFRTQSDTEVLLAALQQWGEDALLRLNGMFAFALWDAKSRRMLIARDRFGEKPLFIGKGKYHTIVIASEMKAITIHPLISCEINQKSIAMYGNNTWNEDSELTFFSDIERLPPAHAAWYGEDGTEKRRWRYWTPDYSEINQTIKPREAIEQFSELFQRSIKIRLRADVPVGSSLSGGLDSSSIVGILARERTNAIFTQNTFSACFPSDPTLSEDKEIADVVSYTGVNSFLVKPDPFQLMEESRLLHWYQEEPFLSASIYLQWCVARLAMQNNTRVLLDGQGADELLAGYQYYFRHWQIDLMEVGKHDLAIRESNKFNRRLMNASRIFDEPQRRFNAHIAYSEDELSTMGKMYPTLSNSPYQDGVAPGRPGYRLRRTLSESLLYNSLPMLLRYADRNSMAFSRETRLPFLDYDLVDYCIRLPDNLYIRNGWQKWILRMSAKGTIPENIRWRADKVGYAAPLDRWLKNELFAWGKTRLMDRRLSKIPGYNAAAISNLWNEHQSGIANHSWSLWRWISLSEWLSIYDAGWWKAGAMQQVNAGLRSR